MTAHHSTKWFWSDWLGAPEVRRLTLAEKGLWIDLLALAAGGKPVGYVCDEAGRPLTHEEIARVTNAASPVEVAELIEAILKKGVASRDRTGRLLNRRMVRDAQLAAKRSRAGKVGADHTNLYWQGKKPLPRQLPQQVPKQNVNGVLGPIPNKIKNSSSEPSGVSEELAKAVRTKWV